MGKKRSRTPQAVVVIGLGRFGTAVASTLMSMGKEVLAIDERAELVQRWAPDLTNAAQADSTDADALRQLGVADFNHAVLAIGTDIESSVLTALALMELNIGNIWAKAITTKHAKILQAIGVHHVVLPEASMGARMAHMISAGLEDYIEFEAGHAMARIDAPAVMAGVPLGQSTVRTRYHITVVGVKRPGERFTYADQDTIVHAHDQVIISGRVDHLEEFARLPKPGEE